MWFEKELFIKFANVYNCGNYMPKRKKNIKTRKSYSKEKTLSGKQGKSVSGNHKNKIKEDVLTPLISKPYILIVVFTALIYGQALFFDFVNFDDNKIKNEVVSTIGGIENIHKVFFQAYGSFYRPLQTALFVFEKEVGGDEPLIYHLTNIILHMITCIAIYLFFKKIKFNNFTAGTAALIYSVHPMFSHSVVWIPSRGDILLTLFTAMTFIWVINFNEKKDTKNLVLSWLGYFLALMSKETGVMIPIVILAYYLLIIKKNIFSGKNMILAGGWIVVSIIWFLMRNSSFTEDMQYKAVNLENFFINLQMIPEMLSKFIYPINIAVMPTFTSEKLIIGIIGIIAAAIGYYFSKNKRKTYTVFGILWFLLFLLPVLFFRLPNAEHYYDYLDHRIYLPMAGIFIFLFEIIPQKWMKAPKKSVIISIFALLFLWGAVNFNQSQQYKNPISFWKGGLEKNPGRAMYHYGMGLAYKLRYGEMEDSVSNYPADIAPDRRQTIQLDMKDYSRIAIERFETALKLDPTTREVSLELGELYFKNQNYEKAVKHFERAKKENPASSLTDVNLAVAYASLGQIDKGITMLEKVTAENPMDKDALFNLYISYKLKNNFEKAFVTAKKMEKAGEPVDWSDYYASYSHYLLNTGNIRKALENSKKALEYNSSNALANMVLGASMLNSGQEGEGVTLLKKSLNLYPNNVEAMNILWNYYNRKGNFEEASKIAERMRAAGVTPK